MITISICMIVKNEEKHLARCLDSLRDLWDELIIVDTGSTDNTRKIAAEYTNHVYDYQWRDDFAHARNYAFSLAQCDYIYAPDADEVLDAQNRRKFSQLKQTLLPEIEIVQMIYVNRHHYKTTENFEKDYRPKLFKRLRTFQWIDPVHETIRLQPVVYDSEIEILHMPDSSHASRDLQILKKTVQRGVRLSSRLHNMYARELFIAGTSQDFQDAENFFAHSLKDPARSDDEHLEALCVLARTARIKKDYPEFLSLCLNGVAASPCAELCLEAGDYYLEIQDYQNAQDWYENARSTPAILDIRSQEAFPLERLRTLKKHFAQGSSEIVPDPPVS